MRSSARLAIDAFMTPATDASAKWGIARSAFPAPFEQIVHLAHDYDQYETWFPAVNRSEVLERHGNDGRIHLQLGFPEIGIQTSAELSVWSESTEGGGHRGGSRLIRGEFKRLECVLVATPVSDDVTDVSVSLCAIPKIAVPRFVVDRISLSTAKRVLMGAHQRILDQ